MLQWSGSFKTHLHLSWFTRVCMQEYMLMLILQIMMDDKVFWFCERIKEEGNGFCRCLVRLLWTISWSIRFE